jgi:hypothetical protein
MMENEIVVFKAGAECKFFIGGPTEEVIIIIIIFILIITIIIKCFYVL